MNYTNGNDTNVSVAAMNNCYIAIQKAIEKHHKTFNPYITFSYLHLFTVRLFSVLDRARLGNA